MKLGLAAIAVAVIGASFILREGSRKVVDGQRSLATAASLPFSPTRIVKGIVSDGVQGIDGGQICLVGSSPRNKLEKVCAMTDPTGAYSLRLITGDYSAIASKEGFDGASIAVVIPRTNSPTDDAIRLDVVLRRAAPTIAGEVVDGTGRPVARAQVAVLQNSALISNATTDASGRFRAWAPNGSVELLVNAPGFQDARARSYAPAADILVTMYSGFAVQGQVLLGRSRVPVPNIRVTATQDETGHPSVHDQSIVTDSEGRFSFDGLPPGKVVFVASARRLMGRAIAHIDPRSAVERVSLLVHEGKEVAGRLLVAPEDRPCSDGWVQLIPHELLEGKDRVDLAAIFAAEPTTDLSKPIAVVAIADRHGIVEFPSIPPGRYASLASCREHELMDGPKQLLIGPVDLAENSWRFTRGLSVAVKVVDENDRAVEFAAITLKPVITRSVTAAEARSNPSSYAARPGVTDMQGFYRFGRLVPGRYELSAHLSGVAQAPAAARTIQVQEGGTEQVVTLILPVAGEIEIHAHDAAEQAVSRLMFFAADASNRRFEAGYAGGGRYRARHLPQGKYRVMAYDNKNPKQLVTGATGEWVQVDGPQPVVLKFQYDAPRAVISGLVSDATGAPVAAAVQAVSVTLDEDDESHASRRAAAEGETYRTTDDHGRFRLDGLVPNAVYRLFAQSRSGQRVELKSVTAGEFVQISLPAFASVAGQVVGVNGAPAAEFIMVADNRDLGVRESRTFKNGRFSFDNLNPGSIDLFAFTRDGALQAETSIRLRSGESRPDIRLALTEPPIEEGE